MGISPGLDAFKLAFELSPIILTGGIASLIPGGMLPIISITEALNFTSGLLSGGEDIDLDDFFAHFWPMAGSTLIDQSVGKYPFANQAVAANAVIRNPLGVSVRMVCPAKGPSGYALKLATMMALQATLQQHNAQGGTYTIATPAFFYVGCVMTQMRDTSDARSQQPQNTWTLDFEKPLLVLEEAVGAQNSLMARISAGLPFNGPPAWSGLGPTVANPSSLGAIGLIPSVGASFGANAALPFGLP